MSSDFIPTVAISNKAEAASSVLLLQTGNTVNTNTSFLSVCQTVQLCKLSFSTVSVCEAETNDMFSLHILEVSR